MHIAVIGAGGVGAYFGGKLAHSGQKVTFIARGESCKVLQTNGLQVKSIAEETYITKNFKVFPNISDLQHPDIVLICTKSWQVAEVAKELATVIHPNTVVIPLQNGADNVDKLLQHLDKQNIMGGLCKLYSKLEQPGVVNHFGHTPELIFGEIERGLISERAKTIHTILNSGGFKCTLSKDIWVDIWTKFMFIATVSGLGGLTRTPIQQMYQNVKLRTLLKQTAEEIYEISQAKDIGLPSNIVATTMNFISKQPEGATASTQRDLMQGKPSELDNFNGYIVREGERLHIATPVNNFIYHCLKPMEEKARKV
ncbi:2-dehydropantoate 2-reductase [Aquimarina sp. ERC-38]|uniref:ketopantoate reductase family protein n=1 Tax=Aquimarina sp. ERC-38 TaxID=2949996 RepID=UPI002246F603|nr:2-dehydropantoate 2-reductase [Aquimarina sp. ERC-38]UZO81699.1 2-dehydropantoate 2-reductase [Aquimarina sp. ERC-38]